MSDLTHIDVVQAATALPAISGLVHADAMIQGVLAGISVSVILLLIYQFAVKRRAVLIHAALFQLTVTAFLITSEMLFSPGALTTNTFWSLQFPFLLIAVTGLQLFLMHSSVSRPDTESRRAIPFISGLALSLILILASLIDFIDRLYLLYLSYLPVMVLLIIATLIFDSLRASRSHIYLMTAASVSALLLFLRLIGFEYQLQWPELLFDAGAYAIVIVHVLMAVIAISENGSKNTSGDIINSNEQSELSSDASERLRDEYVAMVAHEIKTPLSGISGISELLIDGAEGPLSPEVMRNLELISTSSRRLNLLLNNLQDITRVKDNLLHYAPRPVHVRSMVSRVLALQFSKAAMKQIEIRNLVAKNAPNAYVDPGKFEQVLHNLINNSVKFTDEGYVAVDADVQDDRLIITIEDTGQGLSKDHIERLLASFEEDLSKPVPSNTGSGLGLKITNKMIQLMGSSLNMESAQGFGSYFSFSVPITSEPAEVDDQYENYSISRRDPTKPLTRIFPHRNARINERFKIMVVDDEPINIKVLTAQLTRAGYDVISFHHGRDALDYLSVEEIPDLILLDVMMPNLNGFEVCKIIRQEYSQTELPVILLTAKSHTSDILQGFKHGANDYIAKPIAKDELLARIKTHVELSKINHAFSRFVPHEFLRFLGYESILDIKLGDQVQKNMTVLFSDIKDFTRLSENMSPKEAFDFINTFLGVVSPLIRRCGGFIDKFIGDAIMALFPGGADDALRAAILMTEELKKLNQERRKMDVDPILIGTGLHTGDLMLGTIGEELRMEGTVISDVVNTASRLEGLTKVFDSSVIISSETRKQLSNPDQYHFRYLGKTRVKGKNNILDVYGVIEGDDDMSVKLELASAEAFEAGIKEFYDKNFTRASVHFNEVLKTNPGDKAANIFLKRSAYLMVTGVPDDWSGVDEGNMILEQYG